MIKAFGVVDIGTHANFNNFLNRRMRIKTITHDAIRWSAPADSGQRATINAVASNSSGQKTTTTMHSRSTDTVANNTPVAVAGRRADDDRRMSSDSGFCAWGPNGRPDFCPGGPERPESGHSDTTFPLSRPLLLLLRLLRLLLLLLRLLLRLLLWRLR